MRRPDANMDIVDRLRRAAQAAAHEYSRGRSEKERSQPGAGRSGWDHLLDPRTVSEAPDDDLWALFTVVSFHQLGAARRRGAYSMTPAASAILMAVFNAAASYSRNYATVLRHHGLIPRPVRRELDSGARGSHSWRADPARAYVAACMAMLSLIASDNRMLSLAPGD